MSQIIYFNVEWPHNAQIYQYVLTTMVDCPIMLLYTHVQHSQHIISK